MVDTKLWKRGLPPVVDPDINDWLVIFTILDGPWHRRRTDAEKAAVRYIRNSDGTVTVQQVTV